MNQAPTIISVSEDAPQSSGLVLATEPAGAEDELATCVASFTINYKNLNLAVDERTTEWLTEERKQAERFEDNVFPLVDQMQKHLSQRGDLYASVFGVASRASELGQLAEVPTWTKWYAAFSNRITTAPSLRTIQRKLKQFRRVDEPALVVDGDGAEGAITEDVVHVGLCERDELKTRTELLTEHTKKMMDALAGKSVMSDSMRICRAIGLLKDLQRALEEGLLFDAPRVAGYEEVAAAPAKSDSHVDPLNPEPDWKQVLVELIAVLEESGDRLPLGALKEKRKVESLLAGTESCRPERAASSHTTKRYRKLMKLDEDGNRCWTVKAEGERDAWGFFEIESDADEVIQHLNSPGASLSDFGAGSKKLPVSAALDCAGSSSSVHGAGA
jgi:hypothetical protein